MKSYGPDKIYSLSEIIFRLISDETEGFTDYQLLTIKSDQGFDQSDDVKLLHLDSIDSKQLPEVPRCFSIKCDGPVGTTQSLLQDLAGLYARQRHAQHFLDKNTSRPDFQPTIFRSSVVHLDLAPLCQLQPDLALQTLQERINRSKGHIVMVTGLDKISEHKEYKIGRNKRVMTPAYLRAGLIREIEKLDLHSPIVLCGKQEELTKFRKSTLIENFYRNIFDELNGKPYEIFGILQSFLDHPSSKGKAIAGIRGIQGYDQKQVFENFETYLRPYLIHEPDHNKMVRERLAIPEFIGDDLTFYTMKLFDDNDFTLSKKARQTFIQYLVEMSINYGGKGYGEEVSKKQSNKEAEIFAAEVIVCALERFFDEMESDGEIIDLFNALVWQGNGLEPIKRHIVEEDVHKAARSLKGLKLFGRAYFPSKDKKPV